MLQYVALKILVPNYLMFILSFHSLLATGYHLRKVEKRKSCRLVLTLFLFLLVFLRLFQTAKLYWYDLQSGNLGIRDSKQVSTKSAMHQWDKTPNNPVFREKL